MEKEPGRGGMSDEEGTVADRMRSGTDPRSELAKVTCPVLALEVML